MAEPTVVDADMEDDYDEDADSDFDEGSQDDHMSSSSEEEGNTKSTIKSRPRVGRRKPQARKRPAETDGLDSGDEAALEEYRNDQKKLGCKDEAPEEESENSEEGWRARTRGMREREKVERKKRRPINGQNVTIDVDRLWEEMNKPGGTHASTSIAADERLESKPLSTSPSKGRGIETQEAENIPPSGDEEMITIRRTFKFAGEITTEEKVVPKFSAEARLWLSQQANNPEVVSADGRSVRRPLRRISRFDPNYSNLDAFKGAWSSLKAAEQAKARKINVVDKSRQDWAADVDETGDRQALESHAKSKQGYLGQQDTLDRLAQAREAARLGRPKG